MDKVKGFVIEEEGYNIIITIQAVQVDPESKAAIRINIYVRDILTKAFIRAVKSFGVDRVKTIAG